VKSKRTFGEEAPRFLRPVLRKFFKASEADFADDEALHEFRLRSKKLRYAMEILAPAFEPSFRKKLYRRVSSLQDALGMVNDHATTKLSFNNWINKTEDPHQRSLIQGILLAESKAHEDVRQAFAMIWTPKAIRKLRRGFFRCCGMP
jgi:CHAD domain-containing protein